MGTFRLVPGSAPVKLPSIRARVGGLLALSHERRGVIASFLFGVGLGMIIGIFAPRDCDHTPEQSSSSRPDAAQDACCKELVIEVRTIAEKISFVVRCPVEMSCVAPE